MVGMETVVRGRIADNEDRQGDQEKESEQEFV